MNKIYTNYGVLVGATHLQYSPSGNLKQCILTKANEIETPYGTFVPQYMDDGFRRKRVKPLIFHENGNLKNLPLQNKVTVKTSIGDLSAELITWYENKAIRRVFPLDGNLTGFWTEEDEYDLAEGVEVEFPFGKINQKVIAVQFYECGTVKNFTFWPKDTVSIDTPFGTTDVRIGLSVYPDGSLKAFEPSKPLAVDTPIGKLQAYDRMAIGIHSDSLSLRLAKSGAVENIVTSTEMIKVVDEAGSEFVFKPQFKPNMFNLEATDLVPISIQFDDNKVRFNNNPMHEFIINQCSFTVSPVFGQKMDTCTSCASCTACS